METHESKPLDSYFYEARSTLIKALKENDDKINNRIEYIVSYVYNLFNEKVTNIYCNNELNVLDTQSICVTPYISLYNTKDKYRKIIINGKIVEFYRDTCYLPTRWLFENFEPEVAEGRRLYLLSIEDEKNKTQQQFDLLKNNLQKLNEHFTEKQIEGFLSNFLCCLEENAESTEAINKNIKMKNLIKESIY